VSREAAMIDGRLMMQDSLFYQFRPDSNVDARFGNRN